VKAQCSKGCGRDATRRGYCHTHYETRRIRDTAYGRWETLYTPAEPVRQHIHTLKAAGMGGRRIAEISGVSRSVIQSLLNGRKIYNHKTSEQILRRNAQAILNVTPDPAPGARINTCGTTRRLQALVAIGYTQTYLAERMGITAANATHLFHGRRAVNTTTADRAKQIYTELSMTPGPSQRARNHATKHKWAAPLAWDDDTIDDPDTKPDLGDHKPLRWDEKYLELRDLGFTDAAIADRWGIQLHSLIRQLDRHGIPQSAELKLLMRERMCG